MTTGSDTEIVARLEGFDTAAALAAMGGKTSLYLMIVRKFSDMYGNGMPEKIDALLAANDLAALQREAHTFKGLAGSLGHSGLQQAALELETADKTGRPDSEIRAAAAGFLNALAAVTATIQAALA